MDDIRETDLFGNPVRARKGLRGRPSKEITEKEIDMLEAGLVRGWSNERLAKVLGIGLSTLKRNFGPMLKGRSDATDRMQLAVFSATARKAVAGDMAAVRQLRQMMDDDQARLADMRIRSTTTDDDEDEAEVSLGKKELQRREAKKITDGEAGGDWGSDLRPGYTN